jgi:hypothetical protein
VGNGVASMSAPTGAIAFDPSTALDTAAAMAPYDLVVRGCPGGSMTPATGAPAIEQDWTNLGGWLFLAHYESAWLVAGPAPWPSLATFVPPTAATMPNGTVSIDTSTPVGASFALWAVATGLSTTMGTFTAINYRQLCTSIDTTQVTRRLYLDPQLNAGSADIQSFTWEAAQGGRVTFNDVHVSAGNGSAVYPAECTAPYPQEKAIMFQLFETPTCMP